MFYKLKKLVIFFLLGFSFCGCAEKEDDNKKELVSLFFDIHLADAFLHQNTEPNDTVFSKMYYDEMLKKHNLTRTEFTQLLNRESKKLEKMEEVYVMVLDSLSTYKAELMRKDTSINVIKTGN